MGECSRRDEVRWMDPKSIHYTEGRIQWHLQRGAPRSKEVDYPGAVSRRSDETLQSLLRGLLLKDVAVYEIPRIRVIKYKDAWYTFDNKRLWVFRQFGQEVPVQIVDWPTNLQLAKLSKRDGEGVIKEPEIIDKEPEKKFQRHEFMCKQDLLNRVLKWSARDLLGARPPEEMVPIPLLHTTVESYMEVLSQWLLEETRAQIQQNLLKVADFACAGVNIDSDARPISKKSCLRRVICTTDRDAFTMLMRGSKHPKMYHPAASDIVLLATFPPQNPGDVYQPGEYCTLGVVQGGHMSRSSFEVIVRATTHGPMYAELMRKEKTWFVVKLESIVTCQRIWDSLHQPENTPLAEYIATYHAPKISEAEITPALDEVEESKLQIYCGTVRHLNLSQSEAVKSFMTRHLNGDQRFGVELIQGPPGTGKTSTLTAMLTSSVCTSTRILVCAPTNTAVNEAARRFLAQKQQDVENSQTMHFCSDTVPSTCGASSDRQSPCAPLRLGDIVMLGSEDRLVVEGSALKSIFLPLRVKRLLVALHPDSGWETICQTFLMHLVEVSSSNSKGAEQRKLDHIVLKSIGGKVIAHGEVLCNDLPTPHLSTRRMEMIMAVSSSVRNLLGLLASEGCNVGSTSLCEQREQEEVEDGNNQDIKSLSDDVPQILPPPSENLTVISSDDDGPQFSPNTYTDPEAEIDSTFYSDEFMRERQFLTEILTSKSEAPIFPPSAAKSPEWVEAECLESANLIFSTVSSAALRIMKLGLPFSCVIVDEAAQLVEAESAIVMQMKEVKQLILVGDQKQLPATVMSQLAQKHGYARSLFERLQSLGHPCRLLDVQYRMHPAISAFSNKQFYNNKLKNGDNVLMENYGKLAYQDTFGPYAFIDIPEGVEENAGSSKRNLLEAELVLHLIRRVHDSVCAELEKPQSSTKPITVGVVSPYGGQVSFIRDQLGKRDSIYDLEAGANVLDVEVRSIDGFQGRETDIIIFSAVRANQSGRIGFVDDERRMNVAITRGRHAVWILGSASTLCANCKLWRNLIDDAKQVNRFFKATEVEWMKDVINISRKHIHPVLHQKDGDKEDMDIKWPTRFCSLQQPYLSASPKRSGWEYEEPPMTDGPDWSSVVSFESISSPEDERKGHVALGKRPRKAWDQIPVEHDRRSSRRRRFHHFGGGHRSSRERNWCDSDTENRWYHQENNDMRAGGAYSSIPDQVNYDVHILHHGWEQPSTSSQSGWQPDWDSIK